MTVQDEGTIINSELKRRTQKIYSDVLGRAWKMEVLNWDGTVYSTTTNAFNARDQVTLMRQFAGTDQSQTYQDTTMSYDGYGRLQSKHVPEQQDSNGNPTYTTWAYNLDDTIQSVTDARGAIATYGYNNRHLTNGITYTVPQGSNIPATPNVTFAYDAAGNRTSMTDGMGSASYSYNELSQIISEARTFTGLDTFTLGYDYNLAGELKSITDPFSATINYAYDSGGRLSSVTGTSFGGVTTYASNPQFRAWGALKTLAYGNSKTLAVDYNNRLLPMSYEVPGVLKKSYQRNNDGSVQFTQDQLTTNSKFDRSYTYDHVGRVTTALTGQEARGGAATNDRPYNESLTYDAFDNLTTLARLHWDRDDGNGPNTFSNNRMTGFTYDADGQVTLGSTGYYTYDAAGLVRSFGDNDPYHTDQEFDGYGERLKTTAYRWDDVTDQLVTEKITYYVNSTVLGGAVVTELSEQGVKERTSVFAGGIELASQSITSGTQSVQWQHYDPSDASYRATDASGQGVDAREMDPLGANAGLFKPFTWNVPDKKGLPVPFPEIADMLTNTGGGCAFRGMPTSCNSASTDFWGSRIADLPGFGTNWGSFGDLAEWEYSARVRDTIAAASARLRKPKLQPQKPRKPLTPQERKRAEEKRRRDARKGDMDEGPLGGSYPPVTPYEINVVFGGRQFEFVQNDIVNAIVDIANRQACKDAFKKYNLTIPYDVVKSGKLRVAGRAALYQSNASELLGWTSKQVEDSKAKFDEERGLWGSGFWKNLTAERTYPGIPTVVFNPTQIRKFGGIKDVVSHAFIHLGGQPGDPNADVHDLSTFKGYNEILNACR